MPLGSSRVLARAFISSTGSLADHVARGRRSGREPERVVGTWRGVAGRSPVTLLARNEPPGRPCVACGRPGDVVCVACHEGPHGTVLSDGCAGGHGCDEDHRLPLVNSPRSGVYGYTGTAW